ncbi:synaptic plasticity regulator PANTS [Epargyreus clarus]|uniref:synaptic plasticity regulator PANTS n=1 Tax=Epargyreus clarus TaxID=520877 RepID=UPI003C2CC63B
MTMSEAKEEAKVETSQNNEPNTNEPDISILEDTWVIRECETYKDEYKECTSFKGRFHQYFIHGESIDCNQWKKDYDNCCKWEDSKDTKAGEALIISEKKRRLQRLKAHYMNDTWKKRAAPPADWDKPLPEWMRQRDENTYLAQKAKEMREGTNEEESNSFCTIM